MNIIKSFKDWYNKEPDIGCFVRGLAYDMENNPDDWVYGLWQIHNKDKTVIIHFDLDCKTYITGVTLNYDERRFLYKAYNKFCDKLCEKLNDLIAEVENLAAKSQYIEKVDSNWLDELVLNQYS